MHRPLCFAFCLLLGISPATAQQPPSTTTPAGSQKRWDAGGTVGLFQSSPDSIGAPYGDDWYFEGRYAVSVGRYWTEHFKTEVEFATTGEGFRYAQRFANVPGVPPQYSYGVEEYFRLNQLSGRVVWQFLENSWVHPYVFAGAAYDAERRRGRVPEQYFYSSPDPRLPANRILVTGAIDREAETVHRVGGIAGVGAKFYMSPNAYFNTGVIASRAKPATTVSFVGGFGIDF